MAVEDSKKSGVLDIDVGNTRIKWHYLERDKKGGADNSVAGAVAHAEESPWNAVAPALERVERVRVASVAGQAVNQALIDWSLARWGVTPEFAASGSVAGGVTNSYEDPARMGVDRWLAIVAAYHRLQSACLVVDCGSAVTVELVASNGHHLGGYIVPGLRLMRQSLFRDTDAVKVAVEPVPIELEPGRDTAAAVNNGLPLMVLGLIERATGQLQVCADGNAPAILLTGGDATGLLPHLSADAQIAPDLVLEGLALVLP